MADRNFLALTGAAAALLLALSLVWPQGLGAQSPPPFGHVTAAQVQAKAAARAKALDAGKIKKKKVLF